MNEGYLKGDIVIIEVLRDLRLIQTDIGVLATILILGLHQ